MSYRLPRRFGLGSEANERRKVHPDIVLMSPAREEEEEEARIPNINRDSNTFVRIGPKRTTDSPTGAGRVRHVRVQSVRPGEDGSCPARSRKGFIP